MVIISGMSEKHQRSSHTRRSKEMFTKEDLMDLARLYRGRKFDQDVKWFLEYDSWEDYISARLNVDLKHGLNTEDNHEQRIGIFGSNQKEEAERATFWELVKGAFCDKILIILTIMGIFSLILGLAFAKDDEHRAYEWIEGFAIILAVAIVVLVTAINDYQKEKKFAELQELHKNRRCLNFLRDGKLVSLHPGKALVGDVIELTQGCIVPVDGIVIKGNSLQCNEAALTGENDNTEKDTPGECLLRRHDLLKKRGAPTSDHANREIPSPICISGSTVAEGSGYIVAICVGQNSSEGIINTLTEQQDQQTPLEIRLDILANQISLIGMWCAGIAVIVMYIRFFIELGIGTVEWDTGDSLQEMLDYLIVGITVLVVAIPEGLPLAVTISLAYSVKKMQKDNNLVKRLHACETMGGANQICSDKTGTLTQNLMVVRRVCIENKLYQENHLKSLFSEHKEYFKLMKQCINLATNARFELKDDVLVELGSKTQLALLKMLISLNYDEYEKVREEFKHYIIQTNPFSSVRKRSSVVIEFSQDHRRVYVLGASQYILKSCSATYTLKGQCNFIEPHEREEYNKNIDEMASQGLRTLGIAFRDLDDDETDITAVDDLGVPVLETSRLILISIFGIYDPPRDEVPKAIKKCKKAGIKVRMVTGDNKLTAKKIAEQIGIITSNGIVMQGEEFRNQVGGVVCEICRTPECDCPRKPKDGKTPRNDVIGDLAKFKNIIPHLDVLARSQPEDKYTLVTGLKQLGYVVAVTGDGTNDAPALKKANIGFAMGIAGTQLAREAADIILMDDNFSSIVKAVMWGRNIYEAIQKFIQFQLTVNVVAVCCAILGAVTLKQSPLTAVQMLWVNLIMDTFASLALATEQPQKVLLKRPPVEPGSFIVTPRMFKHIFGQAFIQCIVIFAMLYAGEWFLIETEEGEDRILVNQEDDNYVRSGRNYKLNGDEDYKEYYDDPDFGPSRHMTYIFNTFVFFQLFNELNSRRINDEWWMLEGFFKNGMFLFIWIFTVGCQAIMVQWGGYALSAHLDGLSWAQWLICIAFAFICIPWRVVLIPLPNIYIAYFHRIKQEDILDAKEEMPEHKSLTGLLRAPTKKSSQMFHT